MPVNSCCCGVGNPCDAAPSVHFILYRGNEVGEKFVGAYATIERAATGWNWYYVIAYCADFYFSRGVWNVDVTDYGGVITLSMTYSSTLPVFDGSISPADWIVTVNTSPYTIYGVRAVYPSAAYHPPTSGEVIQVGNLIGNIFTNETGKTDNVALPIWDGKLTYNAGALKYYPGGLNNAVRLRLLDGTFNRLFTPTVYLGTYCQALIELDPNTGDVNVDLQTTGTARFSTGLPNVFGAYPFNFGPDPLADFGNTTRYPPYVSVTT